jgi:superfamily II DNA helicase RecQ
VPQLQNSRAALVFAESKRLVERFAGELDSFGAKFYHADLPMKDREQIESDFKSGKIRVLVSTVALGMGFDKKDIDLVVHTYTPASVVQYYQEIGRAGRDGTREARALLLATQPYLCRGARDATQRFITVLAQSGNNVASKKDLVTCCLDDNITEKMAAGALKLGEKKGLFSVSGNDLVRLLRRPSESEETQEVQYEDGRFVSAHYSIS